MKLRSFIPSLVALVTCTKANCLVELYGIGIEEGEKFSNYDQIEAIGSEQYVMKSFNTCEDDREDMVGIQFTLVDKNDDNKVVQLEPMGDVSSGLTCRELKLTSGPIPKIQASYSDEDRAVNGIKYFNKANKFVEFGTVLGNYQEWVFDE